MLPRLLHQKGRGLKRLVRHSSQPVFVKFGAGSREQGARDGVRLAAEIRCDVGHSLTPQGWATRCPLPAGYASTIFGALFGLSPVNPYKYLICRGGNLSAWAKKAWCTRRGSNPQPSASEADALSS